MVEEITYYIQGRLSEEEEIMLWKKLLFNEEELELLEFYILLRQYCSEGFKNESIIEDLLNGLPIF